MGCFGSKLATVDGNNPHVGGSSVQRPQQQQNGAVGANSGRPASGIDAPVSLTSIGYTESDDVTGAFQGFDAGRNGAMHYPRIGIQSLSGGLDVELHRLVIKALDDPDDAYLQINHLIDSGIDVDILDHQGNTALHIAAQNGLEAIVDRLLLAGAYMNANGDGGDTPLHLAVRAGHLACVKSLLRSENINVNIANDQEDTPIHDAILGVATGHSAAADSILDELLDHGASVTQQGGSNIQTPLQVMIYNNMFSHVKKAISKNCSLRTLDHLGNAPIHTAASCGYKDLVSIMLEKDINLVSLKNRDGLTASECAKKENHLELEGYINSAALLCSIQRGDSDSVEILLSRCSSFQPDADDNTAAHIAAQKGNVLIIEQLIKKSVFDIENIASMKNSNLDTPLHLAAKEGHAQVVSLLLNTCNGYQIATMEQNMQGYAPIHLAALKGHLSIIQQIVNAEPPNSSISAVNARDKSNATALHLACFNGNVKVVEFLLAKGSDVNACQLQNKTPLHFAMVTVRIDVIQLLLECGADPLAIDYKRRTPLSIASVRSGGVRTLLTNCMFFRALDHGDLWELQEAARAGANIERLKNFMGDTAVHIAAREGYLDILKWIHSQNISLQLLNYNGEEAIHVACRAGQLEIVRYLLMHEPVLSKSVSEEGDTPLHIAAREGLENLIPLLIQHGAELEHKNGNGNTALHEAICANDYEAVKALLQAGADANAKDNLDGNTPLHFLSNWGSREESDKIAMLLRNYGADAQLLNKLGEPPKIYDGQNGDQTTLDNTVTDLPSNTLIELDEVDEESVSLPGALVSEEFHSVASEQHQSTLANRANPTTFAVRAPGSGAPLSPFICADMPEMHARPSPGPDTTYSLPEDQGSSSSSQPIRRISASRSSYEDLIIRNEDLHIQDKTLGEGSFGTVYLGILHGNKVAVKILKMQHDETRLDGTLSPNEAQRRQKAFLQELGVMEKLRHDNIQVLRGFVQLDGGPAIVSKYYANGSLLNQLKLAARTPKKLNDHFLWQKRLKYAMDISKAIECMHSKQPPIVHRDLKAHNCFIDEHWNCLVGDFGFTKAATAQSTEKGPDDWSCPNNPMWLAPETLSKNGAFTCASDIYAFGMILYEMLMFKPPWSNIHHVRLSNMISQGERPVIPKPEKLIGVKEDNSRFISSGAFELYIDLMKACWSQSPEDRPHIKEVFAELKGIDKILGSSQNKGSSPS